MFLAGSAQYTVNSGTVSISDTIGGGNDALITGGFTVGGAGALELTSGNSYVGGTSIGISGAGTLLANNAAGSATGNGNVTVQNGGTLGGGNAAGTTGFVGDPAGGADLVTVMAGGSIAPGSSPGIFALNADLDMDASSLFEVELNSPLLGVGYDQLVVNGTVDVTGAILSALLGYSPANTDELYILSNDSTDAIVGTFAALPEGATVNLGSYNAKITYLANAPASSLSGGNDVALYDFEAANVEVVPEPSSIALALISLAGLLGMAVVARRRQGAGAFGRCGTR
jgi:hypothetical protein